jgi:hypothetical protein
MTYSALGTVPQGEAEAIDYLDEQLSQLRRV